MVDRDDGGVWEWWHAFCVCGVFNEEFDMPVEAFEGSYSHYVEQHGARGKLFIDLQDTANERTQ